MLIGQPVFVIAAGVALYIHMRPNTNRHAKYTALIIAVSAVWAGHMTAYAVRQPVLQAAMVLIGPLYLLVIGLIAKKIVATDENDKGGIASARTRKLFGKVKDCGKVGIGIICISIYVPILYEFFVWYLAVTYLTLRYLLGECLAQKPILYLRSFSYSNASKSFDIVSRIGSRHGILIGLAHQSQPASELHCDVGVTEHGRFYTVPDDIWKGWVAYYLQICSVAVIDVTVGTQSIIWELEQSRRWLPNDRVLVLRQKGSKMPIPLDMQSLEYDLECDDLDHVMGPLHAWFHRAIYGTKPRSAATGTGDTANSTLLLIVQFVFLIVFGVLVWDSIEDRSDRAKKRIESEQRLIPLKPTSGPFEPNLYWKLKLESGQPLIPLEPTSEPFDLKKAGDYFEGLELIPLEPMSEPFGPSLDSKGDFFELNSERMRRVSPSGRARGQKSEAKDLD